MQQQQPLIGEEELQRVKQRQDDFLKLEVCFIDIL